MGMNGIAISDGDPPLLFLHEVTSMGNQGNQRKDLRGAKYPVREEIGERKTRVDCCLIPIPRLYSPEAIFLVGFALPLIPSLEFLCDRVINSESLQSLLGGWLWPVSSLLQYI